MFTAFLLADEINRAPAKTQSALLQAMQERAVTIDRDTYALDENFTVFATQNPADSEGTYPLPEAQKDRFMVKIRMSPPARDEELTLARRTLGADTPEKVPGRGAGVRGPSLAAGELAQLRAALEQVTMRDELVAYIVDLVRATREHESVLIGAGPRATQSLLPRQPGPRRAGRPRLRDPRTTPGASRRPSSSTGWSFGRSSRSRGSRSARWWRGSWSRWRFPDDRPDERGVPTRRLLVLVLAAAVLAAVAGPVPMLLPVWLLALGGIVLAALGDMAACSRREGPARGSPLRRSTTPASPRTARGTSSSRSPTRRSAP